jgi:hypothetical protein
LALLQHAIKHPDAEYTVSSHRRSHNVVAQTAPVDLLTLQRQGLLRRVTSKRGYGWIPVDDLADRLHVNA